MPKGPPVFQVEVLNFALVTYQVDAERVVAHLPSAYELDTFETDLGRGAFITTTCFCNQDFRLAGVGVPRHTFNESTYRTYVRHKGRVGVYFFGRYLGTEAARLAQRCMARDTYKADFDLRIEQAAQGGYRSYSCQATSELGETSFALQGSAEPVVKAPFASAYELTQFLTYRLHGFYTSSLGFQAHMPVAHPRMKPVSAELSGAHFELWTALGMLDEGSLLVPYSVLVVPEVSFTLHAPRPLL